MHTLDFVSRPSTGKHASSTGFSLTGPQLLLLHVLRSSMNYAETAAAMSWWLLLQIMRPFKHSREDCLTHSIESLSGPFLPKAQIVRDNGLRICRMYLAVIVEGPWGWVKDLPLNQAVIVNAECPVAPGSVHVTASFRRQNEICHSCIQMYALHSHVRIVLHPVCKHIRPC